MRVILATLALAAAPVVLAAPIPAPTVLSRPPFPPPVTGVADSGPRLALVSSRYRDPAILPPELAPPPVWAPNAYRGAALETAVRQGSTVFLVYEGRYLVAADARTRAFRYAFDLTSFTQPPNRGDFEPVTWAREVDGVLYVSNAHQTYAQQTNGRNAYVSAIDLGTKKLRWRSRALIANARTFVVSGDLIVAGYGFTAEPDFLYLLDRRTGRVLRRLRIPSAPVLVSLRGANLHVRTYDRQLVVTLER